MTQKQRNREEVVNTQLAILISRLGALLTQRPSMFTVSIGRMSCLNCAGFVWSLKENSPTIPTRSTSF